MPIPLLEHPKCSTCQKAKKRLDIHGISYENCHIKEQNPTAAELQERHEKSGQPLKEFFNTSDLVYKGLQLGGKLPSMSEQEQFELLSTDGMLMKRPLVIGDDFMLAGFKEVGWGKMLL